MAARDQALFIEAYLGLKRTLKRKSYDSDSDSSVEQSTNRGNKLKHNARFVHKGQLGAADGSSIFTEVVDHAGYQREIISRNPPLVDDDGYEIESDEDEEDIQDAVAAAAEENPYSSIRLEHLLAPLTSVTDLPNHPSLSRPFTSKALSELADQGCDWMHKENAALWEVKPLLTKFCGDHIWVDCKLLVTPDDIHLFDDNVVSRMAAAYKADPSQRPTAEDLPRILHGHDGGPEDKGVPPPGTVSSAENAKAERIEKGSRNSSAADAAQSNGTGSGPFDGTDGNKGDASEEDGTGFIHPLYLAPRSARPQANLGLLDNEADDVRRLLQLWVQKQEEVARGTRKLHEGLLRADRLRKTVFMWSKAEAHCGAQQDMSDGEDWYDKDEWGLVDDLKKGHDEDEEDQQLPQKKTRNRK